MARAPAGVTILLDGRRTHIGPLVRIRPPVDNGSQFPIGGVSRQGKRPSRVDHPEESALKINLPE
jgi:hypothetical protein